jgi:hypothetical protein
MAVLYIDLPGNRPLPQMLALKVAAGNEEIVAVTDQTAALRVLETVSPILVVVSNCADRKIFETTRRLHPAAKTVLTTELPMKDYSEALAGDEHILLDHVIVNKPGTDWTTHELRATLQKLLKGDIFGLEKYLAPGTQIQKAIITGSENRDLHNLAVMKYAQDHKIGQHLSKMIFGISEELLMNAIYDAPVAGGRASFESLPRTAVISLKEDEYATLQYGCDGKLFGISVSDPFGALKRDKLFQYLKKVLMRRDSSTLIDNKKGGAGLGIFKILYSSHALVCNVKPRCHTEFIALVDINDQLRDFSKMARSIHFFEVV